MRKSYQKRLDKISHEVADESPSLDELPEIDGLEEILKLPHPLREASFVSAICKSHKKSKRLKVAQTPLSEWRESSANGLSYENSQN